MKVFFSIPETLTQYELLKCWEGLGAKAGQMSDTRWEGIFFAHLFFKTKCFVWRSICIECMDGLTCSLPFLFSWAGRSLCYRAALLSHFIVGWAAEQSGVAVCVFPSSCLQVQLHYNLLRKYMT